MSEGNLNIYRMVKLKMNIIDRVILLICSLCLTLLSVITIFIPFRNMGILSINNIDFIINNMKDNYIYSIMGLALLFGSIRLVFLSLSGHGDKGKVKYLIQRSKYGEISISSETIVGLVKSVSNKFTGIRNIRTTVDILEGQIYIYLKGEVSPEINITQTTEELQKKTKEHIETCTGVDVNEIKVEINNVTAPIRNVK